ncbi:zinc metalloprotease [Dimargaris verticillata]|uniref:Ste24 endopeptidase n=1 Tax=Dimargaris verticillata TaxID=2761393 RepID=A0A9W8BAL6_9FUNG|nr:zinc metalloprotease [Dimargaris verticillata]
MVAQDDVVFGAYLLGVCVVFPLVMLLVMVNVQIFTLLDQFGVPCPTFLASSWQAVYATFITDPLARYVVPYIPEPLANLTQTLAQSRTGFGKQTERMANDALVLSSNLYENLSTDSVRDLLHATLTGVGMDSLTASRWLQGDLPYKTLIMGIATALYLFETYLTYRQHQRLKVKIRPAAIVSIVTEDDFARANAYGLDKSRFSLVKSLFSHLQTLLVLHYDTLPWLWHAVGTALARYTGLGPEYEITQSMVFFMASMLLTTLLSLPFDLYYTFVVEARHGFNKQTVGLFFQDMVKSLALGGIIGGPIIAGFLRIIQWAGPNFYVHVWVFVVAVQLVMLTIYPTLIQPLFNKFTPLQDDTLRAQIEALAARLQFPLTKLYVVDGSKRSAHSNAYFYGFFKNKRIVLFDTLLDHADHEEICAVLGHELGHWKMNHVLRLFFITQAHIFTLFYLFSLVIHNQAMYHSFGFYDTMPLLVGFMLFQYLYLPVESVIELAMNILSRYNEFQADAFAVSLGYARPLSTALIKLQLKNLGNMNPDPWYSAYHYSHPPLVERLNALEAAEAALDKKAD